MIRLSGVLTASVLMLAVLMSPAAWAQKVEDSSNPPAATDKDGGDPLVLALAAVVRISAEVPANARSAGSLGTDRQGSGVVIDSSGLIVTIGYLIMEANAVSITTSDNVTLAAQVVGYDHGSGFGLLRAPGLKVRPVKLGTATDAREGVTMAAASLGNSQEIRPTRVVSRRPFAGSWEYLLDDAIFTAPPIREFGGAALIDDHGRLVGLGSLLVNDAAGPEKMLRGNMYVPIDLLGPVMSDLLAHGRPMSGTHPWLGIHTDEVRGHLMVGRVSPDGPGAKAGVAPGDIILGVAGEPIADMIDFFRKIRGLGSPGVEVPLNVVQGTTLKTLVVTSGDRHDWLRLDRGH